nr:MAG TPA: hypothetical protein [Caudoviricetes sp.]
MEGNFFVIDPKKMMFLWPTCEGTFFLQIGGHI